MATLSEEGTCIIIATINRIINSLRLAISHLRKSFESTLHVKRNELFDGSKRRKLWVRTALLLRGVAVLRSLILRTMKLTKLGSWQWDLVRTFDD